MSNGALLLIRLTIALAITLAFVWFGWSLGGPTWALIGLLTATPIGGLLLARPIVELTHEGFGWLASQPMKKWEGRYYAFNDVQVRVYEFKGELWFAAADVLKATGVEAIPDSLLAIYPAGARVIPGIRQTCLTLPILEKLLADQRKPEAQKFLLWARRQVVAPWQRKRERSAMFANRKR
jgi:pimeloyl-ACP methyl ester carboxylesterase